METAILRGGQTGKELNLGYIRAQVTPRTQLRHLQALRLRPQPAKGGHRDKPSRVRIHSSDSHYSSELWILASSPSKRMLRAGQAVGPGHPSEGRRGAGERPGLPQAAVLEAPLKCAGNRTHGATTSTDWHCQ